MASGATTKFERFKFKYLSFLYKKCPEGNYHKKTDKLCWCRLNEHSGDWHGGVLDFKTGKELIPYGSIYIDTVHDIWRQIQPYLRYANKSIIEYSSTESVLTEFMNYVSNKK